MSTTQVATTKRSPEEFAVNYPIAKSDGAYNVTIGNITEHEGKIYVNLCMKTLRSKERNAAYVRPVEGTPGKFGPWGPLPQFMQKGMRVTVEVVNGYPNKLSPIATKPLSVAVARAIADEMESEQVLKTAKQIIEDAQIVAPEVETEAEAKLEQVDAEAENTDEKPF